MSVLGRLCALALLASGLSGCHEGEGLGVPPLADPLRGSWRLVLETDGGTTVSEGAVYFHALGVLDDGDLTVFRSVDPTPIMYQRWSWVPEREGEQFKLRSDQEPAANWPIVTFSPVTADGAFADFTWRGKTVRLGARSLDSLVVPQSAHDQ
jgi:hypothetical protein